MPASPTSISGRRLWLCALACATTAASAADRWWDAGTIDIATAGNAASAGGAGNWNSSLLNWDQGNGLAHAAWSNAANDTAIFGGAGSNVTLLGGVTAGRLIFSQSSGTYNLIGAQTLTLAGANPSIINSGAVTIGNSTNATVIAGTSGLSKSGAGALTFQGTAAQQWTGGLNVLAGTLTLNFSNLATPTNMIDSGNAVTLGSGALTVSAKSTGITSQTVNGITLSGGMASLGFTSSASASSAFNLGGITRNAQSALNFTLPTLGSITTNRVNNDQGILGTWASTGSGTSLKYATVSGGNIAALTGTAAADGSALTDTEGKVNYDLATFGGTVQASVSANTIRYTGAAGNTAPGTTLFSANGLMNAGSGLWTIGTGALSIGAERELVINTGAQGIAVSGVIQNNAAGASGLTVTGTGALTLGTANTYSGTTTLNGTSVYGDGGKTIVISSLKNSGVDSEFGSGSQVVLNGAVIQTGATGTSNRDIQVNGTSGFYVKGTFTQTLTGSISGTGNLVTDGDSAFPNPGGTGNLVLAGDNSFSGDVIFQNDSRITLNHVNAVANATLNLSGTRILADLASNNRAYMIGGIKGHVNVNLGTGLNGGGNGMVSIGNNDQSTLYSGALSGAAGLAKVGDGTLTLLGKQAYAGNTVVSEGTLKLGAVAGSSITGNTANGAFTVTNLTSTANLAVGQAVSGTGIGTNAVIVSIDSPTQVTVSVANTGPGTGTTFGFAANSGSLASTSIEVKPGAFLDVSSVAGFSLGAAQTLKGGGTVIGAMSVAGTLSPGTSPGTLNTGSQSWLTGAAYNWQVYDATGAAGSGYDTIAINGTLDLSALLSAGFAINLWSLSAIGPDANGNAINFNAAVDQAWTLASASGGITGFEASDFLVNLEASNGTAGFGNNTNGGTFSVSQSGNDLVLTFTAASVPEPSTVLLGGSGILLLLLHRRRR